MHPTTRSKESLIRDALKAKYKYHHVTIKRSGEITGITNTSIGRVRTPVGHADDFTVEKETPTSDIHLIRKGKIIARFHNASERIIKD